MKISICTLLLAAFCQTKAAHAYSYNGYENQELDKVDHHLFGGRLAEKQDKAKTEDGNVRHRRVEGEVPTPPAMDEDEGVQRVQQSHYVAEDLDFFKNGIDPEHFEWVNPEEIAAGAWTCGFLYPPLGTTPGVLFPAIEVYVCVKFADEQPAKKGNLFMHCGGPSSLSDCWPWQDYPESLRRDYNIFTIDQRGMGRSKPTFAHDECARFPPLRDENGTIIDIDVSIFSEEVKNNYLNTNFSDVESIKLALEVRKRQTLSCWTCKTCGFELKGASQEDGSELHFHFLEYSGTLQLAADINMIRAIINAPVMHLHGISYGTRVFGTYATIYPKYVGLMILDGNISPLADLEVIAKGFALGENTRISYGLFSCSARNAEAPGTCPVDDLPKCISDINTVLSGAGYQSISYERKDILNKAIHLLLNTPRANQLCDVAATGETEALNALYDELLADLSTEPEGPAQTRQSQEEEAYWESVLNTKSGPSSCDDEDSCVNADFPDDYLWLVSSGRGQILPSIVNMIDYYSALYDPDYFARRVKEFGEFYTGAGTGSPVRTFFNEWSAGFNWPKGVPLPPLGNPYLTGIISGQLYDGNTPYIWTQQMRQNFKSTSLLTSQWFKHGLLNSQNPDCQQHIYDYLATGVVQIVDGTVCGTDFGDKSLVTAAFPGAE